MSLDLVNALAVMKTIVAQDSLGHVEGVEFRDTLPLQYFSNLGIEKHHALSTLSGITWSFQQARCMN